MIRNFVQSNQYQNIQVFRPFPLCHAESIDRSHKSTQKIKSNINVGFCFVSINLKSSNNQLSYTAMSAVVPKDFGISKNRLLLYGIIYYGFYGTSGRSKITLLMYCVNCIFHVLMLHNNNIDCSHTIV